MRVVPEGVSLTYLCLDESTSFLDPNQADAYVKTSVPGLHDVPLHEVNRDLFGMGTEFQ